MRFLTSSGAFLSTTVNDQISNLFGPFGCQIRRFADPDSPEKFGNTVKFARIFARSSPRCSPIASRRSWLYCAIGSSLKRLFAYMNEWPCPSREVYCPPLGIVANRLGSSRLNEDT